MAKRPSQQLWSCLGIGGDPNGDCKSDVHVKIIVTVKRESWIPDTGVNIVNVCVLEYIVCIVMS